MKKFLSLVLVFSLAVVSNQAFAKSPTVSITKPITVDKVEAVVEQFILENPEIIIQSMENMQRKQEELQAKQAKQILEKEYDKIANNPMDPVAGNPKGDVTVVEFFDYNCGYCKYVLKHITEVMEDDKNVKFVFKELPILGESSVKASQAAIAVNIVAPEKYFAYHTAVMNMSGEKNEAGLMKIAKSLGLDVAKIKKTMSDKKVNQVLAENRQLAQVLGVKGTPGFVIGKELIPGAANAKVLKAKIKAIRENK